MIPHNDSNYTSLVHLKARDDCTSLTSFACPAEVAVATSVNAQFICEIVKCGLEQKNRQTTFLVNLQVVVVVVYKRNTLKFGG